MYFTKYKKPFTLSFTHFTHFTLKIYAECFYGFYPLLLYVLRFTLFTNSHMHHVFIRRPTNIIDIYIKLECHAYYHYCYCCHFDFTLKSGTFGVSGLVFLGRWTSWHKSGTSREICDRWQPYCVII